MQRVKRRKGLGFKHEAMNDEGGIEQMKPKEDQHVVVGDGREQTELEDGKNGHKQGHFKDKSDKAVEEKVIVVDDNSPDPKYWIQYICKGAVKLALCFMQRVNQTF